MVASMNAVTVLYIMGMPRSGSTILDRILGAHENITSVGELINLPVHGWYNNEYCSCGSRANNCGFWSAVKDAWLKESDLNTVDNYISVQNKLDMLWVRFKSFNIPQSYNEIFRDYTKMTLSLYRSIQSISNKSVIVDSSKNPLRAYLLSLMSGIDLRVIHLVRDARGVAWSKNKSFKKNEQAGVQMDFDSSPIWRTAINWCRINMRCNWVRGCIDDDASLIVCYEDFTIDPGKYLSRIGILIGEDFKALISSLSNGSIKPDGHIIAGNRLRMIPELRLRIDNEWNARLSLYERFLVWLVTSWLFYRYKASC